MTPHYFYASPLYRVARIWTAEELEHPGRGFFLLLQARIVFILLFSMADILGPMQLLPESLVKYVGFFNNILMIIGVLRVFLFTVMAMT